MNYDLIQPLNLGDELFRYYFDGDVKFNQFHSYLRYELKSMFFSKESLNRDIYEYSLGIDGIYFLRKYGQTIRGRFPFLLVHFPLIASYMYLDIH